ncbi:MAG: LptF/LptG family permease [Elusimicrobia bacterium]|nr:LptF/LptG family permease [Elusimicrobiota bacterium]
MSILTRYLLRQFLPIFGAALALFLGVLLMNQFLRLFTLAMLKGLPIGWILACFARLLPAFAGLAVPMAYLVATMTALGHLAESGEIMALRAGGFSHREIARPFLGLALALSALLLVVNHKAGPDGFHSFRQRTSEAARKLARVEVRPRSFTPLGPWRLYTREADPASGRLRGVYLVRPGRADGVRVNAETGRLRLDAGRGVELELADGQLQLPNKDPERFTAGRFARYRVFLPLAPPPAPREPDLQEMTTRELRRRGADPRTSPDHRREYVVEAAARTAGALSPFVFCWVAVPLGLGLRRRARGADFAASLGVMFAFYGLLVVGIGVGRRGDLLAPAAPWLADAAGLAAGAWLTRRAAAR